MTVSKSEGGRGEDEVGSHLIRFRRTEHNRDFCTLAGLMFISTIFIGLQVKNYVAVAFKGYPIHPYTHG